MKKSTAEAASTLRLSNGEGKLSIWSSHAREVPESGLLRALLPADASRGFTRTFQNAEGTEVAVADRRGRVYVLSLLRNRHALVRRPGTPVTAISLLPRHGAAKDLIVGLRTCCLEIWCVETATLRATLANCHAAPPGRDDPSGRRARGEQTVRAIAELCGVQVKGGMLTEAVRAYVAHPSCEELAERTLQQVQEARADAPGDAREVGAMGREL